MLKTTAISVAKKKKQLKAVTGSKIMVSLNDAATLKVFYIALLFFYKYKFVIAVTIHIILHIFITRNYPLFTGILQRQNGGIFLGIRTRASQRAP